jgi:hypothetical protein
MLNSSSKRCLNSELAEMERDTGGAGCCIENAGVLPWVHHAQDAHSEAMQTEDSSGAIWIGKHIHIFEEYYKIQCRELRKDGLAYQQALAKQNRGNPLELALGRRVQQMRAVAKTQTQQKAIFFKANTGTCKKVISLM